MYRITRNTALAAIALAAAQAPAYAVDTGIDWLKISGFGTLAATRANIDDSSGAYFNPSVNSTRGAQDSWNLGVDSKAGIQATALINQKFSATVQLLERKDYESVRRYAEMLVEVQPDSTVAMEAREPIRPMFGPSGVSIGHMRP